MAIRGQQQRRNAGNEDPDDEQPITRADVAEMIGGALTDHFRRKLPGMLTSAIRDVMTERDQRGREPDDDRGDPDPDEDRSRDGARGRRDRRDRDPDPEPAPRRARGDRRDEGDGDRRDDRRDDRRPDPAPGTTSGDRVLRERVRKLEQERAEEQRIAREQARDGELREHLTAIGVDKHRLRGAVALLRESTRYDDKAKTWSFVSNRDGDEEELDLAAGVRSWAGGDEGKSFMAPQSGGGRGPAPRSGAGTRPGAAGARGSSTTSPAKGAAEAKLASKDEAFTNLAGAIDALVGGGNVTLG